jgi:hypothetical protein
MNQLRMQLKGQLADAQRQFRELDFKASGAITLIYGYLSADHDVMGKKIAEAQVEINRLAGIQQEMKNLKAQIAELEEALNG